MLGVALDARGASGKRGPLQPEGALVEGEVPRKGGVQCLANPHDILRAVGVKRPLPHSFVASPQGAASPQRQAVINYSTKESAPPGCRPRPCCSPELQAHCRAALRLLGRGQQTWTVTRSDSLGP